MGWSASQSAKSSLQARAPKATDRSHSAQWLGEAGMRVAMRRVKFSLDGTGPTASSNASGGSRRSHSGRSSVRATARNGAPSSTRAIAASRVSDEHWRAANVYIAPGKTMARSARREEERISLRTSRRAG